MTNGSDGSGDMGTLYRFVPGVRRGFRPSDRFEKSGIQATGQPTTGIELTAKGRRRKGGGEDTASGSVTLNVYGPGDVTGIDPEQVVRVEPEPESREFAPNYFPFVEFDRPDLLWMFSPERADDAGRARPWLNLVTVEETDAVSIEPAGDRPLPVLEFGDGAALDEQLPPLSESWAWAHAQIHGAPKDVLSRMSPQEAQNRWMEWAPGELQEVSNITVSRLISPRNLQPKTDYVACVVPTFRPGKRVGLGKDPFPEGKAADRKIQYAWTLGETSPPLKVPVYYYWRFTAGRSGTFEKLVSALDPVELGPDVGIREVDMTDPGPESLEPRADEDPTVDVPGAMYSEKAMRKVTKVADGSDDGVWREPITYDKADRLQELLNKPEVFGSRLLDWVESPEDANFPVVGPPKYGQWHAGLEGIPEPSPKYDPEWFRELNRNVRNRAAASVGAEVVREHQEQLMSAAWEVVGEIREANRYTRYHQAAAVFGTALEELFSDAGKLGGVDPNESTPWDDYWRHSRELGRIRKLGGQSLEEAMGLGSVLGPERGVVDPAVVPDATSPLGAGAGETAIGAADLGGGSPGTTETGTDGSDSLSMYVGEGVDGVAVSTSRPDGGAVAGGSGDGGGRKGAGGALYTQYLQDFVNRPETSLQFQKLVRLDGQLAGRTGLDAAGYAEALDRVSRQTRLEVAALADTVGARDGRFEGISGRGSPGRIADSVEDAGGPDGRPDGGAVPTVDPSMSARVSGPAGQGPLVTGPLGDDPDGLVPRIQALEAAEETRSALDARIAEGSRRKAEPPDRDEAEPSATGSSGEEPPLVFGLLDGIDSHTDDLRGALRSGAVPAADAVDRARRLATLVGDSLAPLDRAATKAVVDEGIAVPEATTRTEVDAALADLRTAHAELAGALERLAAAVEPPGDETGSGGTGDGSGSGGGESGSGSGTDGAKTDRHLRAAVESVEAVDAETARIRRLMSGGGSVPEVLFRKRTAPLGIAEAPKDPRSGTDTKFDDGALANVLGRRDGHARYFRTRLDRTVTISGVKKFAKAEDPVERVMLAPEFPTPMWRPLKDLSQEYLLPGADGVPADSVGLVVQNREFIESYMTGLSHEMARELLWRRYPTDMQGTYFRRFWNKGKGPAWDLGLGVDTDDETPYDITDIHTWNNSPLRENAPGSGEPSKVVLLVRGKLFDRYPNTVVYAARAVMDGNGGVKPKTPEDFVGDEPDRPWLKFPVFRGNLDPDMTFLGFDLTLDEVKATESEVGPPDRELGWYFVFEERPGETRFGFDEGQPKDATRRPVGIVSKDSSDPVPDWTEGKDVDATTIEDLHSWNGMSWHHIAGKDAEPESISYVSVADSQPGKKDWKITEDVVKGNDDLDENDIAAWNKNGAHMARIAWQRPVRVSMHANELLPEQDFFLDTGRESLPYGVDETPVDESLEDDSFGDFL